MARSKSSGRWLKEHFDDAFVKRAQIEGWRSRAAFKLSEIQEKYCLMRAGMVIVDLGAAPGGWSQCAAKAVGQGGRVIALDVLEMEPVDGVEFICGDFTEDAPLAELESALAGDGVDLVLSDMAPNMSGMGFIDQPKAMYLAELALDFARDRLKPGGAFVVKMFQGTGSDAFLVACRESFGKVMVRKPKASRPRSREVYVVGQHRELD